MVNKRERIAPIALQNYYYVYNCTAYNAWNGVHFKTCPSIHEYIDLILKISLIATKFPEMERSVTTAMYEAVLIN